MQNSGFFWFARKRKAKKPPVEQQQRQQLQAYVTKPLNAYMLFLKEQRPHVKAEACGRGSAGVHSYLGKKVSIF